MNERKLLAAYTASNGYTYKPEYINISLDFPNVVRITVRSSEDYGSSNAFIQMTLEDFRQLIDNAEAAISTPTNPTS